MFRDGLQIVNIIKELIFAKVAGQYQKILKQIW
jgi:hypothetical protein